MGDRQKEGTAGFFSSHSFVYCHAGQRTLLGRGGGGILGMKGEGTHGRRWENPGDRLTDRQLLSVPHLVVLLFFCFRFGYILRYSPRCPRRMAAMLLSNFWLKYKLLNHSRNSELM